MNLKKILFFFSLLSPFLLRALPSDYTVLEGEAIFQEETLICAENTSIEWETFLLESGEKMIFLLPSKDSIVVNFVQKRAPLEVFGEISSNGILYFIHPEGLFIHKEGKIEAIELLCATSDIESIPSLDLATLLSLLRERSHGTLKNEGELIAKEGDIILISENIELISSLQAEQGSLLLESRESFKVETQEKRTSLLSFKDLTIKTKNLSLSTENAVKKNSSLLLKSTTGKIDLQAENLLSLKGGSFLNTDLSLLSFEKDICLKGGTISLEGGSEKNSGVLLRAPGNLYLKAEQDLFIKTGSAPFSSVIISQNPSLSSTNIPKIISLNALEGQISLLCESSLKGDKGGSIQIKGNSKIALKSKGPLSLQGSASKEGSIFIKSKQEEILFSCPNSKLSLLCGAGEKSFIKIEADLDLTLSGKELLLEGGQSILSSCLLKSKKGDLKCNFLQKTLLKGGSKQSPVSLIAKTGDLCFYSEKGSLYIDGGLGGCFLMTKNTTFPDKGDLSIELSRGALLLSGGETGEVVLSTLKGNIDLTIYSNILLSSPSVCTSKKTSLSSEKGNISLLSSNQSIFLKEGSSLITETEGGVTLSAKKNISLGKGPSFHEGAFISAQGDVLLEAKTLSLYSGTSIKAIGNSSSLTLRNGKQGLTLFPHVELENGREAPPSLLSDFSR